MAEPPELSVVVPAYNESARLPGTLSVIKPYLSALRVSWELILVNDGSQDSTMEVIRAEQGHDPGHLRGIDLQPNGGKGRAVAAGVAASQGALVLISDADFSTPIDELPKLRAAIEGGSDVAIGSRGKRDSQVEISQPIHRVLMGKIFNLIVQAVVLPGFWDTQCGFKLWKGGVAREVFAEMKLDVSFVKGRGTDLKNAGICQAIINLAHHFGAIAVAEGIENAIDLQAIHRMGCDLGQGYHFAGPLPEYLAGMSIQRGYTPATPL